MAANAHIVWRALYWVVIFCGVFVILASFLPVVSGESPQPDITSPTSGSVHQLTAGSVLELSCQVAPILPGGERVEGILHLWWCNSSVDSSCYQAVPPSNSTPASPLWNSRVSTTVTDATTILTSSYESVDVSQTASGKYYCAAWAEASSEPPRTANITVEVIDTVPTATSPELTTTEPTLDQDAALVPSSKPKSSPGTEPTRPIAVNDAATTGPPPSPPSKGSSAAVIAAVVIIIIIVIIAIVFVVWFFRFRNQACCKGHRVRARQGSKNESFTSDGGINGFGMSPVQAEMQPFIMRHRCDIFIHHHGTDLTLAEMMRSKLLDQESHLHVTLWSEIAGTGRDSRPSTKRLALSLVHSTTVVLLVSWKYLQHESQRYRLGLSRIPRKVDSVRGKVVIVRRIEEDKVPQDLKTDIAQSLEYNVDTDSKFFWPRFNRAVIPQRDDMLYWRT